MLRKALAIVGLMGVLLASVSCAKRPATSASEPLLTSNATGRIVLGDISSDPLKKIDSYQPLADYLASHLEDFGIGAGEVAIAPDINAMTQMMQSGEVDIYFDSLYPAMIVSEQSGAEPILRRWKKSMAEYHTVFFALTDSDIKSLADLQGRIIGVESAKSTSGYFLPIVYLLEAGLKPVEQQNEIDTTAEDEVGYVFTGEDENTIQWVGSRKVAAGVIDSHSFSRIPLESQAELIILAETETVARQVAVIAADIDPQLRSAIKQLLLELDETAAGQEVLSQFEETAQFDQLPPNSGLERMKELYQVFKRR